MPDSPPSSAFSSAPKLAASWARASLGLKIAAIGVVILILLVPLAMLGGLIRERERLRDAARVEVGAQWGQPQTLGGPVLSIPYTARTTGPDGSARAETRYVHLFPDTLDVRGTLAPEVRTRGIFRVVLYSADLVASGRFPALSTLGDVVGGVPRAALRTDEAFVQVGLTDLVGVRDALRLTWGGQELELDPGLRTTDVFASGVSAPVPLGEGPATFRLPVALNGSGHLAVLPVGRETRLALTSSWATPRFAGAFLPAQRSTGADGFEASWRVLHLNRNFPQAFEGAFGQPTELAPRARYDTLPLQQSPSAAFGVELLVPVDSYQKASRAAKYGALFVFLTFLTFFFVEVLAGRRFHPVQYLLVGFAVAIFYLLLLAFAEHVPFGGAYAFAGVLSIGLVTLYARAVFRTWRLAALVGGLMTLFTGYFYVLLQMESYALLVGSLGLFVTLAVTMYLSRRVNWYRADVAGTPDAPALGHAS
ncbi:MAG: cell envelope integrity protein CreD [Rubricoccaceae bacterium]